MGALFKEPPGVDCLPTRKSGAEQSSEANQGHNHSFSLGHREKVDQGIFIPFLGFWNRGWGWGGGGGKSHLVEESEGCPASHPGELQASHSASSCLFVQ